MRNSENCAGYQARITQDGGAVWQLGGCLFEALPSDAQLLPSLSFATTEEGLAELDGESYVTRDGGQNWQRAR